MNRFSVVCEDGVQRHAEPFRTLDEAQHWANWGHICTNRHTYVPIDPLRRPPEGEGNMAAP
jgi:hypothetical protein